MWLVFLILPKSSVAAQLTRLHGATLSALDYSGELPQFLQQKDCYVRLRALSRIMPTKSAEEKASSEATKKKSKPPQSYAAQKLCEITVARGRLIAASLGIQNYGKLNKDALIPLIRDRLALVESCVECGGGPCLPDDHVFPATEAGSARGSASDGNESDQRHGSTFRRTRSRHGGFRPAEHLG